MARSGRALLGMALLLSPGCTAATRDAPDGATPAEDAAVQPADASTADAMCETTTEDGACCGGEYPPCPVYSCRDVQQGMPDATDGVYTVDRRGGGTAEVYCDMSTEGGGWTLVDNFGTSAGRFADLAPITNATDLAAHGYVSDAQELEFKATALSFYTPNETLGSVARALPDDASEVLVSWRVTFGACGEAIREGSVIIDGDTVDQRLPCHVEVVGKYDYAGPDSTFTLNELDTIVELDYLFVR